ncbi:uncharacterized protein LOC104885320 [Beta vulgaris subsp. vulgaris]|uniref:uncharacterized protein LOC104885320 n=1 Tax=Beta vulgaris subsp. vulgaris TaxID=3555 RepID=UPI00203691C8|nr:uncharacterized protein LOC104885320 [Beta vulgaris subsp. vulgaris]
MRARLDALRNDPIFKDSSGETNGNQLNLMGLMMMEILQGNRERSKTEQEECSNMFKKFCTHNPPTYDGKLDLTEFEEWLNNMEKLFDATQCPDKWKVNFAVFYLKGQADLWWKTAKEMQDQPIFGWEKLKEAMRRQLYPPSLQLQMEFEFIHLKQRNMSVLEYAVKFNELARFVPDLVTTDRQRMNRFEGGLNLDIQVKLAAHMSNSYQELYDRAINVERKMKLHEEVYENGKRKDKPHNSQLSNGFNKRLNTGYSEANHYQRQFLQCNKCGKQGHLEKDCRHGTGQCFRCGKRDHLVRDCPIPDTRGQIRENFGHERIQGNDRNFKYNGNTSNNNKNPTRGASQIGRVYTMRQTEGDDVANGTHSNSNIDA